MRVEINENKCLGKHNGRIWNEIGKSISALRKKGMLCDVRIEVSGENNDEIVIMAHSVVLAASSLFFTEYFSNLQNESEKSHVFSFANVDTKIMVRTIEFLYGDYTPRTHEDLDLLKCGTDLLGISNVLHNIENLEKSTDYSTFMNPDIETW